MGVRGGLVGEFPPPCEAPFFSFSSLGRPLSVGARGVRAVDGASERALCVCVCVCMCMCVCVFLPQALVLPGQSLVHKVRAAPLCIPNKMAGRSSVSSGRPDGPRPRLVDAPAKLVVLGVVEVCSFFRRPPPLPPSCFLPIFLVLRRK